MRDCDDGSDETECEFWGGCSTFNEQITEGKRSFRMTLHKTGVPDILIFQLIKCCAMLIVCLL